jgi:hypothetical protein
MLIKKAPVEKPELNICYTQTISLAPVVSPEIKIEIVKICVSPLHCGLKAAIKI